MLFKNHVLSLQQLLQQQQLQQGLPVAIVVVVITVGYSKHQCLLVELKNLAVVVIADVNEQHSIAVVVAIAIPLC